jgi:hypothetical protein
MGNYICFSTPPKHLSDCIICLQSVHSKIPFICICIVCNSMIHPSCFISYFKHNHLSNTHCPHCQSHACVSFIQTPLIFE